MRAFLSWLGNVIWLTVALTVAVVVADRVAAVFKVPPTPQKVIIEREEPK